MLAMFIYFKQIIAIMLGLTIAMVIYVLKKNHLIGINITQVVMKIKGKSHRKKICSIELHTPGKYSNVGNMVVILYLFYII